MASHPISIGTDRVIVLRADPKRKSFAIFNTHATQILYIKEGSEVSSSNGIPIYAQGNLSMNTLEDGESVTEQWAIIANGAATTGVVFEGQ